MTAIPFVSSSEDAKLARQLHPDAPVVRLRLMDVDKRAASLKGLSLWIDPGFDGLHKALVQDNAYTNYVEEHELEVLRGVPSQTRVDKAVCRVLDDVDQDTAAWLSVPQLPHAKGTTYNATNRKLAKATQSWKESSGYRGRLVLPMIVLHQDSVNSKTGRTPKVRAVASLLRLVEADALWIVEADLNDQKGTGSFEKIRFPGLVALHQELSARLPDSMKVIAGPYWGMNLVLWARGLVDHPAVTLGGSYQYFCPGYVPSGGAHRVAMAPLRRQVIANDKLLAWIATATQKTEDRELRRALRRLRNDLEHKSLMTVRVAAQRQVARFYSEWFSKLAAVSSTGRAVALYQDLSAAYVRSQGLPRFEPGPVARAPGEVARQLMLQCLP